MRQFQAKVVQSVFNGKRPQISLPEHIGHIVQQDATNFVLMFPEDGNLKAKFAVGRTFGVRLFQIHLHVYHLIHFNEDGIYCVQVQWFHILLTKENSRHKITRHKSIKKMFPKFQKSASHRVQLLHILFSYQTSPVPALGLCCYYYYYYLLNILTASLSCYFEIFCICCHVILKVPVACFILRNELMKIFCIIQNIFQFNRYYYSFTIHYRLCLRNPLANLVKDYEH